jgi:cytochrome c5
MNLKKLIIPSLLVPFIIMSCKTTKPVETATTKPTVDCSGTMPIYELDIKPVFEKKCNNCHGKRAAGGYDFTNTEDINRAATNGELLGTIKWEDHYPQMPRQMDKLDDITIKKIECWILGGMKQ